MQSTESLSNMAEAKNPDTEPVNGLHDEGSKEKKIGWSVPLALSREGHGAGAPY